MHRRLSFTERRRRQLARQVDRLNHLESRNMITESLGLMIMGIGLQPAPEMAQPRPEPQGEPGPAPRPAVHATDADVIPIAAARRKQDARASASKAVASPSTAAARPADDAGDWLLLIPRDEAKPDERLLVPPKAKPPLGGGAAQGPRGGSGSTGNGQISSFRVPPPVAGPASPPVVAGPTAGNIPPASAVGRPSVAAPDLSSPGTGGAVDTLNPTGSPSGGRGPSPSIFYGNGSGPTQGQFTYFPSYVLDYNDGTVLFPGVYQLATVGGAVDLRAQVRNTTVSTYSWDTSGLTDATNITGSSTYRLQFDWKLTVSTAETDSVTLTVTDTNGHQEVHTYTFWVPAGTTQGYSSGTTWPQSLAPDTVLASAPLFPSHNVSVDANSGALDTSIDLPSYNPNIPGISLAYDSVAGDPRPIILANHQLDSSLSVPTQVSAQLTFNGTASTTYYYDTSQFIAGDIQQVAQQANATSLATGRYSYSLAIGDIRGTTTTTTLTGSATVLNYASNAFGAGWTLAGLEQITSASGGVILDLGGGDKNLWFTGSFGSGGGTFTDPNGEFSTLTQNVGGSYTRTLTDGTKIDFNSSGSQIDVVDRTGLRTTFAYSGGNLQTITDPFNKVTSFGYSGGYLQTVTDPASRIATFTHSGANLTGVTLPDSSAWAYGYSGGRLTTATDPNSHGVSIVYDSTSRVGTITRPDTSSETFVAYQERGWTNTGTSGSPAAAILLAEARGSTTDPLGDTTDLRSDWNGQGLTDEATDPSGNVATYDRTVNGLATIAIDRLNRISQYTYDTKGNITEVIYPDLNTDQYTYNSFAEPLTHTDANNHTTSFSYDGNGNNTVIQDPLLNLTTMTYTADGMLATVKDANSHTTSYQYDTQDRLTTILYPDGSTNLIGYDSKGDVASTTDGNNHTTTFSHDALNRDTGTTDALSHPTTYVYDSGGNLTVVQAPLSRTTSMLYDSMDRLTTLTDALAHNTLYSYNSGGELTKVTDPMGRVTSYSYDAEARITVATDPLNHSATTVYDAEGEAVQVTDPLGRITTTTYNNRGWVSTVTDGLGNQQSYTYTATGQTSAWSPPGMAQDSVSYGYNADDRLVTFTDALSNTTTYVYDNVGNRIAVTDPNQHTTSVAYDTMNRVVTLTDPLSHATVYGHDSGGNTTTVTDPLGHTATTAYDPLNRATTVTDARGDVTVTQFDTAGRVSVVVDPNLNRTTYGYDAGNNMTTLTTPIGTSTYVYDADHELTDKTDANGRRTTLAYDSGGNNTAERWLTSSGGTVRTISYTYDADHELTGVVDPDATLTFTYDSGGNQVTAATSSTAGQPSVTLFTGFDGQHTRTTLSDNLTSAGLTTFSDDHDERLTTIANSKGGSAGPQVVFGYDPASQLTSITRNNGGSLQTYINTTISYDAAGRVTTIVHYDHARQGMGNTYADTPLATYVYGYDNANRVTSEQDAEGTASFTYDNANELTGASGSRAETYTYDSGGNRTMTGYVTGSDNETTASPGETYTYDAEGNMTGKTDTGTGNAWTYSYDYRNRLTGVLETNSGGTTTLFQATYTYDALGRRIGTDVNGTQTWLVWDGPNPYAQFSGSASLQQRYLYGPAVDEILARTDTGGNTAWYLPDKNGSVRDIVSTSGTVLDHIVYDSFGQVLTETNASNGDQFRFDGMQADFVSALYFADSRYFNSSGGRFQTTDPIGFAGGTSNLYVFCLNNPQNLVDPFGTQDSAPNQQPPFKQDVLNYLNMTDIGRQALQYYKDRGDINIIQSSHIQKTYYFWPPIDAPIRKYNPADFYHEQHLYGLTKFSRLIYISETLCNDPVTYAMTFVHEIEHTKKKGELQARVVEIMCYIQLANALKKPELIYPDYIKNNVVTYDAGKGEYKTDPQALANYIQEIENQTEGKSVVYETDWDFGGSQTVVTLK